MTTVLDASAVLSLLREEPGGDAVAEVLTYSSISAVNFSELVAKLCEWGADADEARQTLVELGLHVIDFDLPQAVEAGALRPRTRSAGLSLGDRACLALAQARGAQALTADRSWAALDIGVEIRVIRP